MGLVILGLGPGPWHQITLEAKMTLERAKEVYLRTCHHPAVAHLPHHLKVHSFDHLYEEHPSWAEINEAIATQMITLARRPQGALYAVPGHPMMGEATVSRILALCTERGIPVRIVAGMSFVEPALSALGLDALHPGLQVMDALDLKIDPSLPAIIGQVYDGKIASALKLALLELYPEEHPVSLVVAAGASGRARVYETPLQQLDRRRNFSHFTCIYVPPLPLEKNLATFGGLARIVARLREPGGCPWDREQTHTSLKPYLLEETYEALQALDEGEPKELCEELGDLLMNILIHAQIASEASEFSIRDVIRSIGEKLIRRHPHVFGELRLSDARQVAANWEVLKGHERGDGSSMLDNIPKVMPALAYTRALFDRVTSAGFGEEKIEAISGSKLSRNLLDEAGQLSPEALGQLFFTLAWAARSRGIDPEGALRSANTGFFQRFSRMENLLVAKGLSLSQLTDKELNRLWEEASKT